MALELAPSLPSWSCFSNQVSGLEAFFLDRFFRLLAGFGLGSSGGAAFSSAYWASTSSPTSA
ncbi:MAG: hypothetical protein KC940_13295, partial [Candidatus Omnitrophica bacterium]|nr:hypothetical protein [Candidatus Omnitrophota bacterium]